LETIAKRKAVFSTKELGALSGSLGKLSVHQAFEKFLMRRWSSPTRLEITYALQVLVVGMSHVIRDGIAFAKASRRPHLGWNFIFVSKVVDALREKGLMYSSISCGMYSHI